MKRHLVILGVVILGLMLNNICLAETVGNPADIHIPPGKGVFSLELADYVTLNVGFDAEFLLEKEFKAVEQSRDVKLEGNWYMAKLSCTLFDRIQPFVKLGWSDLQMSWMDGSELMEVEGDNSAAAWSLGLKAYLLEIEQLKLKMFAAGSYRFTRPDIATVKNRTNLSEEKFDITERQVCAGISREFNIPGYEENLIIPYLGVAYSQTTATVRFKSGTEVINAGTDGQKDNLGLFLGVDLLIIDNLSLNVEGRLLDQEAISTGFTYLF